MKFTLCARDLVGLHTQHLINKRSCRTLAQVWYIITRWARTTFPPLHIVTSWWISFKHIECRWSLTLPFWCQTPSLYTTIWQPSQKKFLLFGVVQRRYLQCCFCSIATSLYWEMSMDWLGILCLPQSWYYILSYNLHGRLTTLFCAELSDIHTIKTSARFFTRMYRLPHIDSSHLCSLWPQQMAAGFVGIYHPYLYGRSCCRDIWSLFKYCDQLAKRRLLSNIYNRNNRPSRGCMGGPICLWVSHICPHGIQDFSNQKITAIVSDKLQKKSRCCHVSGRCAVLRSDDTVQYTEYPNVLLWFRCHQGLSEHIH